MLYDIMANNSTVGRAAISICLGSNQPCHLTSPSPSDKQQPKSRARKRCFFGNPIKTGETQLSGLFPDMKGG